jgi:hypothetical protein
VLENSGLHVCTVVQESNSPVPTAPPQRVPPALTHSRRRVKPVSVCWSEVGGSDPVVMELYGVTLTDCAVLFADFCVWLAQLSGSSTISMASPASGGRVCGRVTKWWPDRGMGFVNATTGGSSAVFLNNALANTEVREGLTIEYEVAPGKKPGQTVALHYLAISDGVRMGERVQTVRSFDLDAETRTEAERWQHHLAATSLTEQLANTKLGASAPGAAPSLSKAQPMWAAYSPRRLQFFGWMDISELKRSSLRLEALVNGPTCRMNLTTEQLPKYKPIRKAFPVMPNFTSEGEEFKPTLLTAVLAAMRIAAAESKSEDALRQYAVVTARKQLKALMCLPERGSLLLYAYKPAEGGPVLLERGRTYEEQPESIGGLWERKVMVKNGPAEEFSYVQTWQP